jgi:Anti-sigma-28 factor, FlgM
MAEIKEEIAQGKYRIDVHAVADAIIRRLLALGAAARVESGNGPERPLSA